MHEERAPGNLISGDELRQFLGRQRWFGGKARTMSSVRIADSAPLSGRAWLIIVDVAFGDGGREQYAVPLALARRDAARAIEERQAGALVLARSGDEIVYDGLFDDNACRALLDATTSRGSIPTATGRLQAGESDPAALSPSASIKRTAPDQSNTSVIFGSELIMKMFRRVEPGINPDVELGTYLTRRGFPHVPATVGTLEYHRDGVAPASLLMVQRFVPNRGNGWEVTLENINRYLMHPGAAPSDYVGLAEVLGRRTGELHRHFAAGEHDAVAPEPYTADELAATAQQMQAQARQQLALLERKLPEIDQPVRTRAEQVLASRDRILGAFDQLRHLSGPLLRIRCHGDYHLGQTLVTDDDVVILDFEGEPARTLAERRAKSSPLRDVAGMLRSFSYAAVAALRGVDGGDATAGTASFVRADAWAAAARSQFLRAYRAATEGAPFLPASAREFDALLVAFTMDKAAYELGYELNNRPDWVDIPIRGLLRLVAPAAPDTARQ